VSDRDRSELAAGELAAWELAAGELAAWEPAAWELAAGELAAGELAAWEPAAWELAAGERARGVRVGAFVDRVRVGSSRKTLIVFDEHGACMFRAKLYLDLRTDCVLSEVTNRWNKSFTVNHEEVVDDDHIEFVIDAGEEVEAFLSAFEASEQVPEVERVDGSHIRLTKRSCGALPIIRRNHGMMQWWDRVSGTQRTFDIVVFRREDLRNIVSELREIGSVELAQLTPYQGAESILSERQAEVVTLALEDGYYEWPRGADAETLADRLDISHSTFLEHLRKAESKLLRSALEGGGRLGGVESSGDLREVGGSETRAD
jgi:predicted DNA binding protein